MCATTYTCIYTQEVQLSFDELLISFKLYCGTNKSCLL